MPRLELRRSGWDIALGALLVVAGLVILGNAAFATEVSVLFIGSMLVIYGVIALAGLGWSHPVRVMRCSCLSGLFVKSH